MTLIPAENIPVRNGSPVLLRIETVADAAPDAPLSLLAIVQTMSPEEIATATADLRAKLDAMGTLVGSEVPEELTALIDQLESDPDHHVAVLGEPFEVCWN